ncbi:hypothetical protein AWB67_00401 [Caballeronia terrestris]|uniref:Uncharacterized protein n=1 Tax=Caballeronia terrestris TaxID=1226301 RepID=A0A158FA41_9BURK|nr:hypothetical protein AWB67_00401 [Caballeronia terrestris]
MPAGVERRPASACVVSTRGVATLKACSIRPGSADYLISAARRVRLCEALPDLDATPSKIRMRAFHFRRSDSSHRLGRLLVICGYWCTLSHGHLNVGSAQTTDPPQHRPEVAVQVASRWGVLVKPPPRALTWRHTTRVSGSQGAVRLHSLILFALYNEVLGNGDSHGRTAQTPRARRIFMSTSAFLLSPASGLLSPWPPTITSRSWRRRFQRFLIRLSGPELIVVDYGSSDGTPDVVASIKASRIKLT